MEEIIRKMLIKMGENPERKGLVKTPSRVSKSLNFLTEGYDLNALEMLREGRFKEEYSGNIYLKGIDFVSLCEHHLLPFWGKCHIAFSPNQYSIGISKITDVVKAFSRRLQLQERLTQEIVNGLKEGLDARGVAVRIDASHMCTMSRGETNFDSQFSTDSKLGDISLDDNWWR